MDETSFKFIFVNKLKANLDKILKQWNCKMMDFILIVFKKKQYLNNVLFLFLHCPIIENKLKNLMVRFTVDYCSWHPSLEKEARNELCLILHMMQHIYCESFLNRSAIWLLYRRGKFECVQDENVALNSIYF